MDNWVVGKEMDCYWLSNDIVGLVGEHDILSTEPIDIIHIKTHTNINKWKRSETLMGLSLTILSWISRINMPRKLR